MAEQSRLGKALYRGQQIAQNYRNECKNIDTDSHRLEAAVTNFGKTFKDQNKELLKQSEIAYNVVSQLSQYFALYALCMSVYSFCLGLQNCGYSKSHSENGGCLDRINRS